jgi:hypothetical protein
MEEYFGKPDNLLPTGTDYSNLALIDTSVRVRGQHFGTF